jgi:predicted transcriptional regulator of viral defense system
MAGATLAKLGAVAEQRWGLLTTAQAEEIGVSRKQLSRLTSTGVLERVLQGVYRMPGSPVLEHQTIYATWLALGGAGPRADDGLAPVVAAGVTAALLHGIGDFFSDGLDFIVPARKSTRFPGVRLRVRKLTRDEVIPLDGVPTLTVERTIADLLEQHTDRSLVADTVRDAVLQGKLLSPRDLVAYLEPVAAARHLGNGASLAGDLFDLAGTAPEGWAHG